MFKFVVLCAFFAAAVGEPEPEPNVVLAAPLAHAVPYSTYYTPGSTTYSHQTSSVVHPSPYFYSSPGFSHFIKKRSPQFPFGYIAPSYYYPAVRTTPAVVSAPLYSAPLAPAAHVPLATTHFIKKRSAPIFPYSYYSAPTTYYANTSPFIAHAQPALYPSVSVPVTHYSTAHLIKKRSAPIFPAPAYVAPYVHHAPTTAYSTYYPGGAFNSHYQSTYSYPAVATHFIKKRSAQFIPATTYYTPTYTAPAPIYSSTYAAPTPIVSSTYYTNPFLYSTYIKK